MLILFSLVDFFNLFMKNKLKIVYMFIIILKRFKGVQMLARVPEIGSGI